MTGLLLYIAIVGLVIGVLMLVIVLKDIHDHAYDEGYEDGLADGNFLSTDYKVEVSDVPVPFEPSEAGGSS